LYIKHRAGGTCTEAHRGGERKGKELFNVIKETGIIPVMSKSALWTRPELLIAFRLYCQTPFGRLHKTNPEIVEIAKAIGRTPSAVAMKLTNIASLDPKIKQQGKKGLGNASKADKELWAEFEANPDAIALEVEAQFEALLADNPTLSSHLDKKFNLPTGPTESEATVKTRRVQRFFRSAVLAVYESRCALSGIQVPELLIASHIIPWKDAPTRRADPRNGLCLNALYDRAFDRGLFTFDESLRVVIAPAIRNSESRGQGSISFVELEGVSLNLPVRFEPDREALAWHRERVFVGA